MLLNEHTIAPEANSTETNKISWLFFVHLIRGF